MESPTRKTLISSAGGGALGAFIFTPSPITGWLVGMGLAGLVISGSQTEQLEAQMKSIEKEGYVPDSLVKRGRVVDSGVGRFQLPNWKDQEKRVAWRIYQGQFWIKQSEQRYLYVDKVLEFEEPPYREKP